MRNVIVLVVSAGLMLAIAGTAGAVQVYVDAAPNTYGSPSYSAWQADAFAKASAGTFVNMANSTNPANIGTTNFSIRDDVVYSFGDLGKRLTWIYWVPDTTVAQLTGHFDISLQNEWDGGWEDFYKDYYGSTWIQPTSWVDYNGGVIGTAGMAWWGAYGVNTQAALDADIAAWQTTHETWVFTVRTGDALYSVTDVREPVPEPVTMAGLMLGLGGLVGYIRKRRAA
jgi:hypothetical protein